jgi:hypothetical protein
VVLALIGFVVAVIYVVKLSTEVSELRDVILWYRKALADMGTSWEEVERSRLVSYRVQPELRPGGVYREGDGVNDMQFVTNEDANRFIARFNRWWSRIRSSRRN